MTLGPAFGGIVLHLPFAPLALRTALDATAARPADAPAADPDDGPHVAEIAVQMCDADAELDLCEAIGTLLTLRSLGHLAFPDAGAPCALTPSGRHLLALNDRVTEVG